MVSAGIGMALGGWLGGALFDMAGDYTWSLLTSLVAGCIGLPLALALPRHGETPPGSRGKIVPTPPAPAVAASAQHRAA